MIRMNIEIVQAVTKDLNIIIALLKELYLELGEEAESIIFVNEELIKKILSSKKTIIYLAKIESGSIVGLITLTESQAIYAGGSFGTIDEMYVIPEFRSNKVGLLLIEEVRSIGQQRGWKRIDVTAPTEKKWERTVRFYERCGFEFTGPKLKMKP
jgi:GNAT superfamily N-acetyltransferase